MDTAERALPAPAERFNVWVWLALAVIASYFVGVWIYALTDPFGDDLAIISSANAFGAASTPAEAWTALSAQHNEHRLVVTRLVFWLADLLPGPLNVKLIAIAGNLSLVVMFALLMREGRRVSAPGAFIVVVAVMMFNFGLSESSIWPMAAVSNFGVLAAMLAMFVLLSRGGAWTWLAALCALIAVGMQGNGLLAPFLGATYLLFNRRLLYAALLAAVGVAAAVWFLTGYVSPAQGKDVATLASNAGSILIYALAFCGSAAGFGSDSLGAINFVFVSTSATMGAALIGLSIYAASRGGLDKGRIALWINAFVIVSAFATAVSRFDYGLQQALVPRYHINSCLMIVTTLIALLDLAEGDPVGAFIRKAMKVFAIIACVYALAVTPILLILHRIYHSAPSIEAAAISSPTALVWPSTT